MSTPGAVTSKFFDQYFPPSRYDLHGNPWYGGWLGEEAGQIQRLNKDNYELFSAGGIDFLIIHLEIDMPTYAVQWADEIIDRYPDRRRSQHARVPQHLERTTDVRVTDPPDGLSAAQVWTSSSPRTATCSWSSTATTRARVALTSNNSCGEPSTRS